jgi:D-threo-aldose 1-dehydrogenase
VDGPALVRRALELGLRHVDTAPLYGHGTAERDVGAAIRGMQRDTFVLSTKAGRPLRTVGMSSRASAVARDAVLGGPDEWRRMGGRALAFAKRLARLHGDPGAPRWTATTTQRDASYDGVLRSVEDSLARLGTDHIDLLLLHEPTDPVDVVVAGAGMAMRRLRDQGTVRAIGIGHNDGTAIVPYLDALGVDCVLLGYQYTLLDQGAATTLLPEALRRRIPVVLGGPFASGILADRDVDGRRYDYGPVTSQVARRLLRLRLVCDRHEVPLRTAALQFPFRHPAIVSVIVGAASAVELDDAVADLRRPIPPDFWDALEAESLVEPGERWAAAS